MSSWQLVQFKTKADGGTLAFDNNVAAGNYLVVAFECDGALDPNPATPTDTVGTVYSVLRPKIVTPNSQCVALWGGIAPASGANTVTADSTTSFDALVIAEFSFVNGLAGGVTLDDSDDNYLSSITVGADGAVGDLMTPVGADGLALMLLGTDNGGGMTFSDGSTMTVVGSTPLASSANDRLVLAYASLNGTPASYTPKLSTSGGSGTDSGQILEAIISPLLATDVISRLHGLPRKVNDEAPFLYRPWIRT